MFIKNMYGRLKMLDGSLTTLIFLYKKLWLTLTQAGFLDFWEAECSTFWYARKFNKIMGLDGHKVNTRVKV